MRSRKNAYKQQLEVRLQAAKQAESVPPAPPAPKPKADPLPNFTDPTIRAEVLSDELRDARAALAAERKARAAAEKRAAQVGADRQQAGSRSTLANLISKRRRAP